MHVDFIRRTPLWSLGLACFLMAKPVTAQEVESPESVTALSQSFIAQQKLLGEEVSELINQGGSESDIKAWMNQNSAILQFQLQTAQQLSAECYLEPMSLATEVEIPEGTSQEGEEFLVAQGTINGSLAQIHNSVIQIQSDTVTVDSIKSLEAAEMTTFWQQNSSAIAAQVQRAQDLARVTLHTPQEDPPVMSIPPTTSSLMRSYLTLQHQLDQEEIDVHNRYCEGTDSELETAIEQWQAQHAADFQQLNQMAVSLAAENAALQNQN